MNGSYFVCLNWEAQWLVALSVIAEQHSLLVFVSLAPWESSENTSKCDSVR